MLYIRKSIAVLTAGLFVFVNSAAEAGIRGGGGGNRGGGGGGGIRAGGGGGGGGARPAARPSAPNLGGGGASRPAPRPNISRPAVSKPAPNRPQFNPPSGGLKPANRPSIGAGGSGIKLPNGGNQARPNLPNAGNRPATRPSIPNLGGGGASKLPGNIANRPGNSNLPNNRLPGNSLPNRPGNGGGVGGKLPGRPVDRPSPGDLGDFLGMNRPVRPETLPGNVRPGLENRPGINGRPGLENRPGIGGRPGLENRPGNLPGINNRPGISNRPGIDNRPGFNNDLNLGNRVTNIGDIRIGNNNTIINRRPSWSNIDRNGIANINNRWQNQIGGIQNWGNRYPNRINHWNVWGNNVRVNIGNRYGGCFGNSWWRGHAHPWCGWHYGYRFPNHGWGYWWRIPTYAALTSWFTWSAPPAVWAQPVYYDYGQGGNVTYNNNNVYIDGQQVATADEFAQSAAALATVEPPASEEEAEQADWMPLGTFAVSANEKDEDPTRVVQLAVDKTGIVSGTLYNSATDQSQTVQGQVDKDTQRVAVRIGESDDIIVEAGLYNLTQSEANALVHFGPDRVEEWLLVRIENPEADSEDAVPNP